MPLSISVEKYLYQFGINHRKTFYFLVFVFCFLLQGLKSQENSGKIRYISSEEGAAQYSLHKKSKANTQIRFKNISAEEGLSQSTVFCLIKDSQGFMWFGTRGGGLNKYDGYNFTVYKNDPYDPYSLSTNEVISLLEDSKGRLWAGTRKGGLNLFNPIIERFTHFYPDTDSNSISGNTVTIIFEDSQENLWIGTNKGLDLYRNGIFIHNKIPGIKDSHITSMDEDEEGNLYITGKSGLYIYDIELKTVQYFRNQATSTVVGKTNYSLPLLIDSKGNIWMGSVDGLKIFTNSSFIRFEDAYQTKYGPKTEVRHIHEDSKGNIWIGSRTGLYKFNPNTNTLRQFKKNENNPLSLNHNSIYCIYEDNTGIIWIGTWGGGVNILTDKLLKFEHFKHQNYNPQSLSNNIVSAFEEDKNGIWVGTELGGLNYLKNGSKNFIHYKPIENDPNSLSDIHIKTLYIDPKDRLWIGTFGGGLNLFDKRTNTFSHFMPEGRIFSIIEGPYQDLWIGTLHGLYRFNYDQNKWKRYSHDPNNNTSLAHDFVTTLFIDKDSVMWVGTKEAGLMKYNPELDNFIHYSNTPDDSLSLPSNYIISINEDNRGEVLIGTSNGLCRYANENDNFMRIEIKGIPDRNITGILVDNKSNYWISTYGGITKLSDDGSVINYNIKDGLQSNEFNRNAYFKSKSGKFYFGGINGFNSFYPDMMPVNREVPQLLITDFKISNNSVKPNEEDSPLSKPISETKQITLQHDQSDISFDYVALNYYDPEKNQYMYMLEGYNDNWIFAGKSRVATYTNLDAGEYVFKVKAANSDGLWNQEGTSIHITVIPPF